MGNRAVITTEEKKLGIYLHWNGGRASIKGFLDACKELKFRSPETNNYGWARLCQVISNFFGRDGLSISIDTYDCLDADNGDNGVYIIKDWQIVGREYFSGHEEINEKKTQEIKETCLEQMARIDEREDD